VVTVQAEAVSGEQRGNGSLLLLNLWYNIAAPSLINRQNIFHFVESPRKFSIGELLFVSAPPQREQIRSR